MPAPDPSAREKVGRVPGSQVVSRRRLLVGLVAIPPLGLLAGCTSDNDGQPSPTTSPEPDLDIPAVEAALARERDLLALYAVAPPEAQPAFQPFVDRHRAHAAVLARAVSVSPTGSPLGSTAGSTPSVPPTAPSVSLPADQPSARAALALAETAAADAGVAALAPVSAELARTLAAIAACEAAHAALLRSG
jgi:hypothetical protein